MRTVTVSDNPSAASECPDCDKLPPQLKLYCGDVSPVIVAGIVTLATLQQIGSGSVICTCGIGVTRSSIVTTLSQPNLLVKMAVFRPAAVNTLSFHTIGSSLAHTVLSNSTVSVGFTSNTIVTILSQPLTVGNVVTFVPAAVNTLSFHVNGNSFSQMVSLTVTSYVGKTVRS